MQVTEVNAMVRYSAEAKGAWRSIEVGATATLTDPDESLESAQQELYNRLASQLKTLWYKGNGRDGEVIDASPGSQAPARGPLVAPDQHDGPAQGRGAPDHWCSEHGVEFKQFSKNGNSWFSHKTAEGTWHNRGNQ
jgi:hypothetical protein